MSKYQLKLLFLFKLSVAFCSSHNATCQGIDQAFFNKELALNFKNKPTVIEFWATWCGPCIIALKKTDSLVSKYQDQINFYAISDEGSDQIQAFLKRRKFNHTFISDTLEKSFKRYEISGIPHVLMINAKGNLVWSGSPTKLSSSFLEDLIKNKIVLKKTKLKTSENKDWETLNRNDTYLFKALDLNSDEVTGYSLKFKDFDNYVEIKSISGKEFIMQEVMEKISERDFQFTLDMKARNSFLYINRRDSATVAKKDFIQNVLKHFDIRIDTTQVKESVYYIKSINYAKLSEHKTLLKNKEGINKSGGSVGWENNFKTIIMIGKSLKELTQALNLYNNEAYIERSNEELEKYDFELPIHSIKETLRILEEKYGIIMEIKESEVEKYRILKGIN